SARSTDQADVGGTGEELATQELADLSAQGSRKTVQIQCRDRLLARQLRLLQQPRHTSIGAVIGFERDELGEIPDRAPAFGAGALRQLHVVLEERGQMHGSESQL